MIFTILLLIIGLFILVVFGVLWSILVIDSVLHGHDLPTSRRATKSIIKIISENKTAKNFYDLGCAKGEFAVRIKRNIPNISVYGIDNNPTRIFFAKLRSLFFRCEVKFLRKNIFEVDLSDADIVYTYLWYDIMPLLEKKLQDELKQGAIVITNTSNFPNWKPISKVVTCPQKFIGTPDFETLFIYQKL